MSVKKAKRDGQEKEVRGKEDGNCRDAMMALSNMTGLKVHS